MALTQTQVFSGTPTATLAPSDTTTGLPGMKRGIAIGIACSVVVVLIPLLACFAIRRHKRIAMSNRHESKNKQEDREDSWWHEKTVQIYVPPVEADIRSIYELDTDKTPELPLITEVYELEANMGGIARPELQQNRPNVRPEATGLEELEYGCHR